MEPVHQYAAVVAVALVVVAAVMTGIGGIGAVDEAPLPEPDTTADPATTADAATTADPATTADAATTDADADGASDLTFVEVSETTGLNYTAGSSDRGTAAPDHKGAYTVDFNDDGWTDVFLIGGERPLLYQNTGGSFQPSGSLPQGAFGDVQLNGALFFDYNGNGREDLLVLPDQGEPIFLANNGSGFVERDVGLRVNLTKPAGAAVADYDGDGDLDLFIIQYGSWADDRPAGVGNEATDFTGDNGERNLLFRNTDSGFENVTGQAGISGTRWSLATSFVDFSGNGLPDIHVANDFNNDVVYLNRGNGTFDQTVLDETDRNAMSSEAVDVSGNGRLDVFVTNIYFREGGGEDKQQFLDLIGHQMEGRMHGNNLLINRGDGTFEDRAAEFGVRKGGWGWAVTVTDFDNDGNRDVFQANQDMRDAVNMPLDIGPTPFIVSPMFWERTGDSFERRSSQNLGFEKTDGRAVVAFDYDNDGDQDLLLTVRGGSYRLYENRGESGNYLTLDVRDEAGAPALGANVTVTVDDERRWYAVKSEADYQSQEPRTVHVGLGDANTVDRVRVTWPDGSQRILEDVPANQTLRVRPG